MATGGESSTSVDMSQVLQSIAALTSAVDARLSNLKEELLQEQKAENDRLSKRIKLEKKFEFRK